MTAICTCVNPPLARSGKDKDDKRGDFFCVRCKLWHNEAYGSRPGHGASANEIETMGGTTTARALIFAKYGMIPQDKGVRET